MHEGNPLCSLDTVVDRPFDRAQGAVRAALAAQGFSVLTEIDAGRHLRGEARRHGSAAQILGACNPTLAHRALELDPRVALVLPCNVVLRGEGPRTSISIADPRELLDAPAFAELSVQAAHRLERALASLHDVVTEQR